MTVISTVADDLRLPQTVIVRLIKEALPHGTIVSKEARIAITRSAAVFILQLSTYAQECAVSNRRKMVTALDVMNAVKSLDCLELEEPLKDGIEIWKKNKQKKNEEQRKRKAERVQSAKASVVQQSKSQKKQDVIVIEASGNQPITKKPTLETT